MNPEETTYTAEDHAKDQLTLAELIKHCRDLIKIREDEEQADLIRRTNVIKKLLIKGVVSRGQAANILVDFGWTELDTCSILEEWDNEQIAG